MTYTGPLPPTFTPTQWRRPNTGEMKLQVVYRSGWVDREPCTAGQRRWTDTGSEWDIVGVKKWG